MERRDVAPTVAEILAAAKLLSEAAPLRKTVILCTPEGRKLLDREIPTVTWPSASFGMLDATPVNVMNLPGELYAEAMRLCGLGRDVFLVTRHGVVGPDGVLAMYEWFETWGDHIPGTSFLWRP